MAIISISLPDESIEALERIEKALDLKGRSETVRISLKMAESEIKKIEGLEGEMEGVLVIVHGTHGDQWMNTIQHRYEKIIRTQMHSHLQNRNCLEVMILSSDSETLGKMMEDIYSAGKADYIKFVRSR